MKYFLLKISEQCQIIFKFVNIFALWIIEIINNNNSKCLLYIQQMLVILGMSSFLFSLNSSLKVTKLFVKYLDAKIKSWQSSELNNTSKMLIVL